MTVVPGNPTPKRSAPTWTTNLPTKLIFKYVTHFDAKPPGLEWIDDTTCAHLFASTIAAKAPLHHTSSESQHERDFVLGQSVPMAFCRPINALTQV